MLSIPLINLQTVSGTELVDTLARSSCVLLTDHGIASERLGALLDTADQFFALPRAEKEKVEWPGEGPWYGWQPVSEAGPYADLMERYELRLPAEMEKTNIEQWSASFPAWPQQPAEFRHAWSQCYAELHGMATQVMQRLAEGLQREDHNLAHWTELQHSNLVVNHYFPQTEAPAQGRWRAHPHTDIGAITLLWADDAPGGLEVCLSESGEWVPVVIPENCWLLQVGDLLNLWSGGRIPANPHRVANPPANAKKTVRRSVVFFHHPHPSAIVTPPEGDPRSAVSSGDYILQRQKDDITGTAQVPS